MTLKLAWDPTWRLLGVINHALKLRKLVLNGGPAACVTCRLFSLGASEERKVKTKGKASKVGYLADIGI